MSLHEQTRSTPTQQVAFRAVQNFRKLKPGLQALLRSVARDQRLQLVIEPCGGQARTNGTKVIIPPPIELGYDLRHQKSVCDMRDEDNQLMCSACRSHEEVLVKLYHEAAHVVGGTFDAVAESEMRFTVESAVRTMARDDDEKFAQRVAERINGMPHSVKSTYMGLSQAVSPFLPTIINALEDVRVNRGMFDSRPGVQTMFEAWAKRLMLNGKPDPKTGKIIYWYDFPLNTQMGAALFGKASGYNLEGFFSDTVLKALEDPTVNGYLLQLRQAQSSRDTYRLAFPLLSRLRELGFFIDAKSDPEDTIPPEPEPEPEPESDDDGQADDTEQGDDGAEGDADSSSDDGQGSADPTDDDDVQTESDDQNSDEGDDSGGTSEGDSESDSGADDGTSGSEPDAEEPDAGESDTGDSDGDSNGAGETSTDASSGGVGEPDESPDTNDGGTQAEASGTGDSDAEPSDSSDQSDRDSDGGTDSGGSTGAQDSQDSESDDPGGSRDLPSTEEQQDQGDGRDEGSGSDEEASTDGSGHTSDDGGSTENGDGADEPSDAGEDPGEADASGGEPTGTSDTQAGDDGEDQSDGDAGRISDSDVQDGSDGDDGNPSNGGKTNEVYDGDELSDDEVRGERSGSAGDEDDEAGLDDEDSEPAESDYETTGDYEGPPIPYGERGDAETVNSDLASLYGHDETGELEDKNGGGWGEDAQEAIDEMIDQAIRQAERFDTPSLEVSGVVIHTRDEEIDDRSPWDHMSDHRIHNPRARERLETVGVLIGDKPDEHLLGRALLKTRRAFDDNTRKKHERNLKSGRVNGKALARRVPLDDPRLFQKARRPGKRSYLVIIGVDISGSQGNGSLKLTKMAAFAQAELLSRVGVKFEVWAHTGTHDTTDYMGGMKLDMACIKRVNEPWDTTRRERLATLGYMGANLDGHSLEFYRKILDSHPHATDKIIMYYTDGAMPAANYDEELDILQRELRICKRQGYTVMGVGIETDSPTEHGLDTCQIDDMTDLSKVVAFLEKKLEGN